MANETIEPISPKLTRLSRRDLLGFAAKGAASVVVSQSFLAGCAAAGNSVTDSARTGGTTPVAAGGTTAAGAGPTCVLTAALTEGPFFVDEKLNRSDIRTDPVTGSTSAGAPLALTFNVSRVANQACTR